MDVTIPRSALIELAKHAAHIAPNASPSKIITHLRLVARDSRVTVTATDYALTYEGSRAATVAAPGSVCINARVLRDCAGMLHDGPVRVTREGKRSSVTLATGKRSYTLPVLDGEDYPGVQHAAGVAADVDSSALGGTLRRTAHAQGALAHKPDFAGARLTVHGREVRAEATDGVRLAQSARDGATGGDAAVLVPSVYVAQLAAALADVARVKVTVGDERVTVDAGEDRWTTRTFTGKVPDGLDGFVPPFRCAVDVDRAELVGSLDAAAVASPDSDRVTFGCDPDERRLRILAETAGDRAVYDELDAVYTGESPPQRWNGQRSYLLAALRGLDCERVELRMGEGTTPLTIIDPTDARYRTVIAPMGA